MISRRRGDTGERMEAMSEPTKIEEGNRDREHRRLVQISADDFRCRCLWTFTYSINNVPKGTESEV